MDWHDNAANHGMGVGMAPLRGAGSTFNGTTNVLSDQDLQTWGHSMWANDHLQL